MSSAFSSAIERLSTTAAHLSINMPPTPWAVIAGVGAGTGSAIAKRFARAYPVALLARTSESYAALADEINASGGKAVGISTDVTDASSIKAAFAKIEKEWGSSCAVAVFNASSKFVRKSILELTEEEFTAGYTVSGKGAFLFTKAAMPFLIKTAEEGKTEFPPTIVYTGATASIKSNALMSSFSSGKYALRAFVQSAAREFAPKGVHVAHAIIDGLIDIPASKEMTKKMAKEASIKPEGIADAYWNLHTQPNTAFTNEIDIRPMLEKW